MLFPQWNLLVSPSDSAAGASHDAMLCRILTKNIFILTRGLVASFAQRRLSNPLPY